MHIGVGIAVVTYMTLQRTLISPYEALEHLKTVRDMEGVKYDCVLAIIRSAIVSALTLSGYIAFKSRK